MAKRKRYKAVFARFFVILNFSLFYSLNSLFLIMHEINGGLIIITITFTHIVVILRLGGCVAMKIFTLTPQYVVAANFSLRRIYAG